MQSRPLDGARIELRFSVTDTGPGTRAMEVADVLSEEKQREIEEVVERLRRFEPTKIWSSGRRSGRTSSTSTVPKIAPAR